MTLKTLDFDSTSWPVERLGDLLEHIAIKSKLAKPDLKISQSISLAEGFSDSRLDRWVDVASGMLGLEAERVEAWYADLSDFIQYSSPAIIKLPGNSTSTKKFLGLIRGGKKNSLLLKPDLSTCRVSNESIRESLAAPLEQATLGGIDHLLSEAGIPKDRVPEVSKAILQDQLGANQIDAGWLIRLPGGSKITDLFKTNGIFKPAGLMLILYFIQQILAILSWIMIARGIFQGYFDWGWLIAWVFILLAAIPLQLFVSDAQIELSIRAGIIFKKRLLLGSLKLNPDDTRQFGFGQLLNRVMDSEAVEMLAFNGGFMALLSILELLLAVFILKQGAGGWVQVFSLIVWVGITLVLLWKYYRESTKWTDQYRSMTNDIVERMVGHRTRIVQEPPSSWHIEEDEELDSYVQNSISLDSIGQKISAITTRGWLLIGLAGLAIPFINNSGSIQSLAIGLGGVLFATQALGRLTSGFQSLTGLFIAWKQVGPIFKAAEKPRELQALDLTSFHDESSLANTESKKQSRPVLTARDIRFRFNPNGREIINNCSMVVFEGDRILLQGPSGGGKSTLAALLAGLRIPESGTLLLNGLDIRILGGEEWRRKVVIAPQFHENHVFSETLGFNLLMGRQWPPTPEDLSEAETVCKELGLGELLEKMPSGFQQMLGESGWQLSHGEKSRLFIARTLLQNADVLIMDESFGALDPDNLRKSLETVDRRAPSLLVIAHP
jgi:ATP-binding cassette subfamily B protein